MTFQHRLMGLETEYAFRLPEYFESAERPIESHRDAYEAICATLRKLVPAAEADPVGGAKIGWFLGTGGAVWFESCFPTDTVGLIEGATPECRSARDLLACQRAQDRLLSRAASENGVALLKNCHDRDGNIYGAQENYEISIGDDESLKGWRTACRWLIFPTAILLNLCVLVVLLFMLLTIPVSATCYLVAKLWNRSPQRRRRSFDFWLGRTLRKPWNGFDAPFGAWLSYPLLRTMQLLVFPIACLTRIALKLTRLPAIHRQLTAFVISRIVFAGAGRVKRNGVFLLAGKAHGIRRVTGLAEYGFPIFSLGQFLKPAITIVRFAELQEARQRVQISIGDSNMCEEAEYLRIGTTAMILDLICSESRNDLPELVRPMKALRLFNNDLPLTKTAKLKDGRKVSAIQLQRLYLEACRDHVEATRPDDEEAYDILNRWDEVLRTLEQDPERLLGRIDWVTKLFLLKQSGTAGDIDAWRKIDVKYHEQSADGYFRQFETTDLAEAVLDDSEIAAAMRLPPGGTPATTRARLIREFAGTDVKVGWKKLSNGMRIE